MSDEPTDTNADQAQSAQRPIRSGALPMPRDTTPTWEVELLISGVAVFAMLQLPGWLDANVFALRPRLSEIWLQPVTLFHMYLKGAAVILSVTFVLHLLSRAHWIALIGMHSVFPDGIRWDRLRVGPVETRTARQKLPDIPTVIERADNRSTIIFTMGVSLASTLLLITLMLFVFYPAGVLGLMLAGVEQTPWKLMLIILLPIMVPYPLAHTIDRRFGGKLDPAGIPARVLDAIFRLYAFGGFGRSSNASLAVLTSHGGEGRFSLLFGGLVIAAMAFSVFTTVVGQRPERAGNYASFPFARTGDANGVNPNYYADRRKPLLASNRPFIQSDLPQDAYLRLVVPYDPIRDAPALTDCQLAELPDTEEEEVEIDRVKLLRRQQLLACLAALHPVMLDALPVADIRYDVSVDDTSDRPALQAMIDIRHLLPGRHELTVAHPPDPEDVDDEGNPEPNPPHRIPFWR